MSDISNSENTNNMRDSLGRLLPNNNANPTGKGGFKDNPQNINYGGRKKNEQRFGYWLQFFKDMTTKEFSDYPKTTKKPEEMFVAELISYERVKKARNDLKEYQDLADRTEGKAVVNTNISGDLTLSNLLGELTNENFTQEPTENIKL